MQLIARFGDVLQERTDLLVLGVYQNEEFPDIVAKVDNLLSGVVADALARKEFVGKILDTWLVHTLGALVARRVLLVGLGSKEEFSANSLRRVTGQVSQRAHTLKAETVLFHMPEMRIGVEMAAKVAAEGFLLGGWRFAGYQSEPVEQTVRSVSLMGFSSQTGVQRGLDQGIKIAEGQNLTRDLGWRPSNRLYPELLAKEAVVAGQAHGFSVDVFDEKKLAELGMGAILGVGQGSAHPPRMVVMRYQGGGTRTLGLVGKGITFDSGGISLKPPQGMEEMKYDMLGAGAVLGAMCAIADTKPPINVVGIMAIAQNMPSGSAYKPGDVLKAFNGKTIEITNTDAEGRVVLADAVSYAAHLGVDWIVEASTLTGAAIIVLGHEATALVSTDDPLASLVLQAAEEAGERVWRLPAYPEYKDLYKSEIADMKNAPGRDAGTITAGMIIAEFSGQVPYAHLDIAGTGWADKNALNAKFGPTGVMVRTFVQLAHNLGQ